MDPKTAMAEAMASADRYDPVHDKGGTKPPATKPPKWRAPLRAVPPAFRALKARLKT